MEDIYNIKIYLFTWRSYIYIVEQIKTVRVWFDWWCYFFANINTQAIQQLSSGDDLDYSRLHNTRTSTIPANYKYIYFS